MVTQKKVVSLGSILILLIAGIFLSNFISENSSKRATGKMFPDLSISDVAKIEILEKGSGVVVTEESGKWLVERSSNDENFIGYTADTVKVNSLLEKLTLISRDLILSKGGGATDETYDVTDEKGIVVKAINSDGLTLAQFTIGKKEKNWRNSAIKKVGDDNIYSVGGSIRFAFKSKLEDWRDRVIFNVPQEKIVSVSAIDSAGTAYSLAKDSTGIWSMSLPVVLDIEAAKMESYLKNIAFLTVSSWAETNVVEDKGFENPYTTVEFKLDDGKEYKLTVGKKDGERNRYFAKSSISDDIYILYPTGVGKTVPSIWRFQTPKAAEATPAK
jgi:hypothetical protein